MFSHLQIFKSALFYAGQIALKIPARPSSILKFGEAAGVKIHSSSWGVAGNGYSFNERDLDDYLVENPDLLLILAAGNSGDKPNSVGSPATCKNGLTGTLEMHQINCCPSRIPTPHSFDAVQLALAITQKCLRRRVCLAQNILHGFQAVDQLMMVDLNRMSLPLGILYNQRNQGLRYEASVTRRIKTEMELMDACTAQEHQWLHPSLLEAPLLCDSILRRAGFPPEAASKEIR